MQTRVFGKPGWIFLHCIGHNYSPSIHNPQDYKEFYRLLGKVLPCKYCRKSYQQFFKELPIDDYLGCQRDMAYWMYLMHNKVNDKLRKQGLFDKPNPSFQSVYNKYEQFRADCASKKGKPDTCRMPEMKSRCRQMTGRGRQCTRKQTGQGCCTQHQKCRSKMQSGGQRRRPRRRTRSRPRRRTRSRPRRRTKSRRRRRTRSRRRSRRMTRSGR